MKKLVLPIVCSSFLFTGPALSAPPPKSTILHCGCVITATGDAAMQFVQISVSSKAKGHQKHVTGTTDTCFNSAGLPFEFVRTSSDCSATGGAPLSGGAICDADQVVGATCGVPEVGLN